MNITLKQLKTAADHYAAEFGDLPDYRRWQDIGKLIDACNDWDAIESLADHDDAYITGGELHSLILVLG